VGWAKKLHAKAAAEKQQSITLVNQSFDERKMVVMRSDASDKTAKQNESDDHFRLCRPLGQNRCVRHRGCHVSTSLPMPTGARD
jgi:hypothetical protein